MACTPLAPDVVTPAPDAGYVVVADEVTGQWAARWSGRLTAKDVIRLSAVRPRRDVTVTWWAGRDDWGFTVTAADPATLAKACDRWHRLAQQTRQRPVQVRDLPAWPLPSGQVG
ncbi:hypothetical protein PS9374_04510 [Planomonospora sphaerica]|uniref:Uncharacterized protein n=1 Tax=Planomonospora sphaerica TaxID=161355 RepID=A0A161LMZ3_9ACTN|nr:hypothetical protein [Planomonospora sphaerica]GAT68845.1 hypothetical protein PS9374_04510 [Planomonospora sphaerica]